MKKLLALILMTMMLLACLSVNILATDGSAPTLDEIINGMQDVEDVNEGNKNTTNNNEGNFISEMQDASDLSTEQPGVAEITSGIKVVASYVIQILSYIVVVLLVLRVVLDLAYIGLPFCRAFLANGYQGNAQAGAGGVPNSMAAGGMSGLGNMGSPSMGGMSMAGGLGGMRNAAGANPMGGMNQSVVNNNVNNGYKVQLVSNAALNAVAAESSIGPDGKAVSPFKLYVSDMVVVLVLAPALLILAVTGALTDLGFFLGGLIVDLISGLSSKLG